MRKHHSFLWQTGLLQSNLVIRNGLKRNKLVLRNHFLWPICHLLHKTGLWQWDNANSVSRYLYKKEGVSKLSFKGCQNLDLCITTNCQIQNWVGKSFVHYSLFLYNPVLRGWHHPTYLHRLRNGMILFLKDSLLIFMYLRFPEIFF